MEYRDEKIGRRGMLAAAGSLAVWDTSTALGATTAAPPQGTPVLAQYIDRLRSPTGGGMVGFLQSGTDAVARTAEAKLRDTVNILDFIPVAEHAAIIAGTSTYNAATDVQAAIDAVNDISGGTLVVRGRVFLGGSVNIDRPVDTSTGDLIIQGLGNGAGFHCAAAITMFGSTIPHTTGPVTERVIFKDICFSCANFATPAFVMSEKFLRVEFDFCRFERIKCNNSNIYMQSWRWVSCNIWRWRGSFSKTDEQAYDCHASMTKFEGATSGGDAFDWRLPQGCSVHQGIFEGALGCHVRAMSCNGLSVAGNYTENHNVANPDYIFALQSAGGRGRGVSFTGNHINTQNDDPGFYPVILGKTGGFGGGNYANANLYDDTDVKTGDFTSSGDVPGGRLQKSNISLAALPAGIKTLSASLTAHARGGQRNATLLPSQVNVISTTANASDSVILPAITGDSTKCLEVYVLNNGANAANVYPPSGHNFQFAATNAPNSLAGGGTSRIYRYLGAGAWTVA